MPPVVVCDLETSRMGAPCIYDISRLRVKGFLATFVAYQPFGHLAAHEIINAEGVLHASSAHLSNFLHLHVYGMKI